MFGFTNHRKPLPGGDSRPTTHDAGAAPRERVRVLLMCAVDFTVRQFLLPLARGLQDEGYRVTIACTDGPYSDEIRAQGFDLRHNPVARSANVLSHLGSIWRTYQLLRRERFDVIHVHTPIAALVGRIAGRLAGVPVKIYTAHGFYFHDEMAPWKRRAHIALEKLGAACGDFIMTVSDEDRQTAITVGIASQDDVETIYNGVDTDHFCGDRFSDADRAKLRDTLGIPQDAPVVGIVGRLVREKGFFELFEAAALLRAKHPECRFLLVGGKLPSDYDSNESAMKQRIQELGVADRIVMSGLVPDTAPYLSLMDVFTLPSYREGMPISLLEAMSMNLACVATDIRGCREEIVDNVCGRLVPTRNAQALAAAIDDYLTNKEKAAQHGVAARLRTLELFHLPTVTNHQLAIYRRLLSVM